MEVVEKTITEGFEEKKMVIGRAVEPIPNRLNGMEKPSPFRIG